MKKQLTVILLTGGAAAAVIALSSSSALAATWSVTPGGSWTASLNKGTTTVLKDNTSGNSITCTVSRSTGSLKTGHGLPAAGLGSIKSVTFGTATTKCTGPLGSTWTAAGSNTPWSLNAVSYKASVNGGQTSGTITGHGAGVGGTLHGTVLGAHCTATVGGTTSAKASAKFLYDNGSGLLAVTGTTHLKVLTSNCPGLSVGDSTTFYTNPISTAGHAVSHGYAVKPKQKITSP